MEPWPRLRQHPARRGGARPQRVDGRTGQQGKRGWADIPIMAWAPCAATGQGQVVGAAAAGEKL